MIQLTSVIFAQASQGTPPATPPKGVQSNPSAGMTQMLIPLLLIFAIFYFMIIRPDQRRRKEHQKLLGAIKPGDRVITSGGIHGIVANVKDKIILLRIADNVKIELQKSNVQMVLPADQSAGMTQKS